MKNVSLAGGLFAGWYQTRIATGTWVGSASETFITNVSQQCQLNTINNVNNVNNVNAVNLADDLSKQIGPASGRYFYHTVDRGVPDAIGDGVVGGIGGRDVPDEHKLSIST